MSIDLSNKIGKIVTLELVSGAQVTTRIRSVVDGVINCGKMICYIHQPDPRNPSAIQVINFEYGQPFYKQPETNHIQVEHVMFVWDVPATMEQKHTELTSGIQMVNANALKDLPSLHV